MIGSAGRTAYQPPPPQKSGALKTTLTLVAIVIVCAALAGGGWYFYSKQKAAGNSAAQVPEPKASATMQALSTLSKVYAAYTNVTSVKSKGTLSAFLDLSKITVGDVSFGRPLDSKSASQHPRGMPNVVTNITEFSIKSAGTNLYCLVGEAVSKIDRMMMTNTFALWSPGQGKFMFMDSHQRRSSPIYQQLPEAGTDGNPAEQFKNLQHLFADPANLNKIVKDLGQTADETVEGQDCETLTAKIFGQKLKIWVDKNSHLISQSEITLGGELSDADIDDAFSLVSVAFTNMPPMQLEMIKTQVKKMSPILTKIRGTITSTTKDIEVNPELSAEDFKYPVPAGAKLIRL